MLARPRGRSRRCDSFGQRSHGVPTVMEVWLRDLGQDASSTFGPTLSNGLRAVTP
jgi:hypothetical protein